MAGLYVEDTQLRPGDIVMLQFELVGANQTLTDLAIHQIKQTVANDKRFNYQGSEIGEGPDEEGNTLRVLNVYVQVRKTPKQEQAEPQLAGVGLTAVVSIGVLIGLVCAAIIAHSGQVIYRTHSINKIAASNMPIPVKIATLNALGVEGKGGGGWAGILVTGGIIIGALWLMSQKKGA